MITTTMMTMTMTIMMMMMMIEEEQKEKMTMKYSLYIEETAFSLVGEASTTIIKLRL